MEPKEICAICLGALNVGEGHALFTAECSHTFHFRCITSNVQYGNHICPTCRCTWKNLPSQFTPNFTPLLFADDEPLTSPPTIASDPSSSPSCSINDDIMTVKALPEYAALSKSDQSNCFPVLVAIQAPPLSPAASDSPTDRALIDLIAVLDVSGSMQGDKIRLLKQAVGFVVDNLSPKDRLSVITFSSSARRVTPLRRMTDAGQSDTVRHVNSLQTASSTNIIAGLRMAVEVPVQRRETNPVCSIILLSDGQDNQNGNGSDFYRSLNNLPPCLRDNGNAPQTNVIPVHTFGFGADHDATALHAIAEGSGGTSSYIESIEIIQDAFARCIGGLLSVVSQEVKIHLSSATPGVQIQSISSGRYRSSIDSDGLSGTIYVGEVYAEEEKKFLAYLSVPPANNETLTTQLIEVTCSYKEPLSSHSIMSDIVSVEICRPLAEDLSEEDRRVCLEVDREMIRVSVSEGITEAQSMAERGELSGARAMLQQRMIELMQSASAQAGDALCQRLKGEVGEILEGMRSRSEYESRGRAYAYSRSIAHMTQRASTLAVSSRFAQQRRHFRFRQSSISPTNCSSYSDPPEEMEYQTPFMRKMVQKSHELLKFGNPSE